MALDPIAAHRVADPSGHGDAKAHTVGCSGEINHQKVAVMQPMTRFGKPQESGTFQNSVCFGKQVFSHGMPGDCPVKVPGPRVSTPGVWPGSFFTGPDAFCLWRGVG